MQANGKSLDRVMLTAVVVLFFFGLGSCQTTSVSPLPEKAAASPIQETARDQLGEIKRQVLSRLSAQYYNHKTKPIIQVALNQPVTDYPGEPQFSGYLFEEMSSFLAGMNQISLVGPGQKAPDCRVVMRLVTARQQTKGGPAGRLVVIIEDVGSDRAVDAFILPIDRVALSPEYAAYRASHPFVAANRDWPFLTVEAVNIGTTFETFEREFGAVVSSANRYSVEGEYGEDYRQSGENLDETSETDRVSGEYSQTIERFSMKNYGDSAWYPMNQKLSINGKEYPLASDDRFYADRVRPGKLELVVSFRAGYWDGKAKEQRAGKRYSKTFIYNIAPKQKASIQFEFICNHEKRDIKMKVLPN